MKNYSNLLLGFIVLLFVSCASKNQEEILVKQVEIKKEKQQEPHRFGGWYCPDNLHGFPAVNIQDWEKVPVIQGRMPSEQEVKTEASLIYVNPKEYPDAKIISKQFPKLGKFFNKHTQREELVIVIQGFTVQKDTILGFRYLNGGNGSSRFHEIQFLSEKEIQEIPKNTFVTGKIEIIAGEKKIWKVLTDMSYRRELQALFDPKKELSKKWFEKTNVNYHYPKAKTPTATFGDKMFGSYYIQNDFQEHNFTIKFFLDFDQKTNTTHLVYACGPFEKNDSEAQNQLVKWTEQIKMLAEMKMYGADLE
ncbi:MAG: hypothetical protein N4A45_00660 [Flavobacteriales bacterium]|jgi:hypothetical protein|nr:hypothetical protein [Flavobacteriales bacterium]